MGLIFLTHIYSSQSPHHSHKKHFQIQTWSLGLPSPCLQIFSYIASSRRCPEPHDLTEILFYTIPDIFLSFRVYQNVLWWLMHWCTLRKESIQSEIPDNSYIVLSHQTMGQAWICWTHKTLNEHLSLELNARFDWITEAYVSLSKYIFSFQHRLINL